MTKRHQNITIKRGDDIELRIPVVDENEVPVDLTNAQEIKWAMFDAIGSGVDETKLLKLLTLSQISIIQINGEGAVLDGIVITVESSDTEALSPGNYQHEVEVTELDGTKFTPSEGVVHLSKDLITPGVVAPPGSGAGTDGFFVEDGDPNIIALKNGNNVQALRVYRDASEPSYWAAAWNAVLGFFSAVTGNYDYNIFAGTPSGKLNVWLGGVIQWVFDGITLEPRGGGGIGTEANKVGTIRQAGWIIDGLAGPRQGVQIIIAGNGNNLAPARNVFRLAGTGASQAVSMNPSVNGQSSMVTIVFDDSNVTMIDSGSAGAANTFNLAGNFVSSPDATLTLLYVGSPGSGNARWLEVARSSN